MTGDDSGTSAGQSPAGQPPTSRRRSRSEHCMKGIGSAMISVGLMSIVISSVMVALNDVFITDYAGSGIWCGLFFIATGCCAANAISSLNTDTIVATIVTAIVSLLLAATMIGAVSTSLASQKQYGGFIGFKAAEGLLIALGVTEIVLCGVSIAVSTRYLRQNRQQNDSTSAATGKSERGRSTNRSDGSGNGDDGGGFSTLEGETPANDRSKDPYHFPTIQHRSTVKWIGLWQIAVGLASIVVGSVIVSQEAYKDSGIGIWCGTIFTVTGALTFYAASTKSKGAMIATVVMSALSLLLLWVMLIGSSIFLPNFFWCRSENYCNTRSELAIENGLLVVLSVGELIMSLWGMIICSMAICRPEFCFCCLCCNPQALTAGAGGGIALPTAQGMSHAGIQAHPPATGNVHTRTERSETTGTASS